MKAMHDSLAYIALFCDKWSCVISLPFKSEAKQRQITLEGNFPKEQSLVTLDNSSFKQ